MAKEVQQIFQAQNFRDSDLGDLYVFNREKQKDLDDIIQKRKDQLKFKGREITDFEIYDIAKNHDVNYNSEFHDGPQRYFDFGGSTFMEDVSDYYELSYLGQIYNDIKANGIEGLGEPDLNFNPYKSEKFIGYEEYADKFIDVINEAHMDRIINKINYNNTLRNRINNSERWFWPAFISGVLDPINLISIHPALRGAKTFKQRFKRGGAAVTGIIAPTEVIRYNIDPTATKTEVGLALGTSYLIGGLLTGAIGRGVGTTVDDTEFRQLTNGKTFQELSDNYNTAHEFHGAKGADYDWDYNVRQDIPNVDTQEVPRMKGKRQAVKIIGETAEERPRIILDMDIIRRKWERSPKRFKAVVGTLANFKKIEIKKAVDRDYLGVQRKPEETQFQYDRRLDQLALDSFFANKADRRTETGMVGRWIERITNYGLILNDRTVKSAGVRNYLIDSMFSISGDFATRSISARAGRAFNGSIALDVKINHDKFVRQMNRILDDSYVAFAREIGGTDPTAPQLKVLTYNLPKQLKRVTGAFDRFVNRFTTHPQDNRRMSFARHKEMITQAIIDDELYEDLPSPLLKNAVDELRDIFAHYNLENKKYGLYATPESVQGRLLRLRSYQDQLTDIINENKNVNTPASKMKIKVAQETLAEVKEKVNIIKKINENKNYLLKTDSFVPDPRNYIPLIFDKHAIIENKEAFINWLAGKFADPRYQKFEVDIRTGETKALDTSPEARRKRAEDFTERLIAEDADDFDGILGKAKDKTGKYVYGLSPFQRRTLNLDAKEFLKETNGIADFIHTDIEYLMRQYIQRTSTAIETTKRFGDPHLEGFNIETKIRFIKDEINNQADVDSMNRILGLVNAEKGKLSGTLSLEDPSSFNKRAAGALRDWGSLAMMGKVVISATVDIARPIMVNGIRRTFGTGLGTFMKNNEAYFQSVQNLRYMGVALEVTMGMARKRFIEDGGQVGVGNGKLARWFDKQANRLHNFQAPFYTLNGLTPWTQMMKDFQGVISAHRIIEDSRKWSSGNLTNQDQLRLISLGIDKRTADVIAKVPVEDFDGLLTANADNWGTVAGGDNAARKFKEALVADINRTIVTPSPADQLSMMHGVIKITDPKKLKLFENSFLAEKLGYRTTEYGGQFNNAFMALPFQFMSWGYAANRKILVSGLQGREQNIIMGVVAMITMGMMADAMKNYNAWKRKTRREQLIRGIEMSGVLGLFGDMNFILENLSQGYTGQMVGLRALAGVGGRFGEANAIDATGELVGAGPSLLLDTIYAFGGEDSTFSERRSAIRRLIPLQNLWYWDNTFKSMYNKATNTLKPEEEINDNT
mgnify:CR=1 FL=1